MSGAWRACGVLVLLAAVSAAQEAPPGEAAVADARRPKAVRTRGVPVLPPDLPRWLDAYQGVAPAAFAGWAPDGAALVRARFQDTPQLGLVRGPGRPPEQLTRRRQPVRGQFVPGREDPLLLVWMDTGGDEQRQIYRWEGGWLVRLTGGAARNVVQAYGPRGRVAVVASDRRDGRHADLYRLDLETGRSELLFRVDEGFWGAADWSPDGRELLLYRYVSVSEVHPHRLDLTVPGGALRPLPLREGVEATAVGGMAYAPDGGSVYLTSDARGERLELACVDLESGAWRWLTGDLAWDVEAFAVDRRSGRVAFAVNAGGESDLYLLGPEGRRRAVELPPGVVSDLAFSPDGRRLGFTLARPDRPAGVWVVEVAAGEAGPWCEGRVPAALGSGVVPERHAVPTFDGRRVPASVYLPPGASAEAPAPAVVYLHGGPEAQHRPRFQPLIQLLALELGVAVVAPDVRGSTGYGRSWAALDDGRRRGDAVRDVGAVLDWIAARPELDGRRVALLGGSYGGYLVLSALGAYGERVRAGIAVAAITDLVTFLETTSPYRRDLRRAEYGDERDPEVRAFLEEASPLRRVEAIEAALLLAHGANDPRVPVALAERLAGALRAAGKTVWTVIAEDEGHGFARKVNLDYLQAVEVEFLRRHLLGGE